MRPEHTRVLSENIFSVAKRKGFVSALTLAEAIMSRVDSPKILVTTLIVMLTQRSAEAAIWWIRGKGLKSGYTMALFGLVPEAVELLTRAGSSINVTRTRPPGTFRVTFVCGINSYTTNWPADLSETDARTRLKDILCIPSDAVIVGMISEGTVEFMKPERVIR